MATPTQDGTPRDRRLKKMILELEQEMLRLTRALVDCTRRSRSAANSRDSSN